MPLPIPKLDDRRFKELATTLRDQIPGFTKEWTDFNPSDPGITLLELWCWLAEMVLYRINKIPQRSYDNFFKLVLDPPEPVTAEVTLEILPQLSDVPIPAGISFRTRPCITMTSPPGVHPLSDGGRWIFETYTETPVPTISLGSPPSFSPSEYEQVTFKVRSKVVIENKELGVSNGRPDQIFDFEVIENEEFAVIDHGQVLVDQNNVGTGTNDYNPNPRIKVGIESWQFVRDFLESGPDSLHFIVEQRANRVRFGNGKGSQGRGKIPPAGARIVAERYQIILGKEVRIDENMFEEMDPIPGLPPEEIVEQKNDSAEGGEYLYSFKEEASTTGLQLYKEEFRTITPEDFVTLATARFNRAQESDCVPERPGNRVARAGAVPGKKIQGNTIQGYTIQDEPAAISVIILPKTINPIDFPVVEGQEFEKLKKKVFSFLNRRRLIATRLYVAGPQFVPVKLEIEATAEPRTNTELVKSEIKRSIGEYFHPLTGGQEGVGWPLGRAVHKSELFQLIEGVKGIDHTDRIVMNGDPSRNETTLTENQLPRIGDIEIHF